MFDYFVRVLKHICYIFYYKLTRRSVLVVVDVVFSVYVLLLLFLSFCISIDSMLCIITAIYSLIELLVYNIPYITL